MSDTLNGWGWIEDAPKDGTIIMIGVWDMDEGDDGLPREPFWIATIGYLEKMVGIIDGNRDYQVYDEFGEMMRGGSIFTHWHPMPAPPSMPEDK